MRDERTNAMNALYDPFDLDDYPPAFSPRRGLTMDEARDLGTAPTPALDDLTPGEIAADQLHESLERECLL